MSRLAKISRAYCLNRGTSVQPEDYEGNGPPRGGRIGGGISNGGEGNKNDGVPPGNNLNNNNNANGPPPCHNHNGNGMTNTPGSGNAGGGGYRLASDPLPPVHSLGLGGHF